MTDSYLTQNLRLVRKLGTGAYGLVYLVEDCHTHQQFAVKVLSQKNNNKHYSTVKPSVFLQQQFDTLLEQHNNNLSKIMRPVAFRELLHTQYASLKEISYHLRVHDHPNIVSIKEIFRVNYYNNTLPEDTFYFIVMDYFSNGDLFQLIVEKKFFMTSSPAADNQKIKKFFNQLLSAVDYCHSRRVYHFDIKPENVLIGNNFETVLLTDFGLATSCPYFNGGHCSGSIYYMAPEKLNKPNKQFYQNDISKLVFPSSSSDIWSLGIILINMSCMRNPWQKASVLQDGTFARYATNPKMAANNNKNNSSVFGKRILYDILPISKEVFFILTQYLLNLNFAKRGSLNLSLLQRLINSCKCFRRDIVKTSSSAISSVAEPSSKNGAKPVINGRAVAAFNTNNERKRKVSTHDEVPSYGSSSSSSSISYLSSSNSSISSTTSSNPDDSRSICSSNCSCSFKSEDDRERANDEIDDLGFNKRRRLVLQY